MTICWRTVKFGFACWVILFVVAVLASAFRQSMRPLFESVMAVAVTATAVGLGLAYLRRGKTRSPQHALGLGLAWFGICIVVDAPLMLLGGPMKMSIWQYMADVGLTYLCIPVVTFGLELATQRQSTT